MNTNLFVNFYHDKKLARQKELEACIFSNIENPELNNITIIIEDKDIYRLQKFLHSIKSCNLRKISLTSMGKRPSFNDYFKLTEGHPDDINIISNTDIILDTESLKKLKKWNWKNYCLALSRWDFTSKLRDPKSAILFNRADSQDTWILKGSFPQIKNFCYGMGVPGVDNSLAHHLSNKYDIINPSLDIKTYHFHLTNSRNYKNWRGKTIERVPLPYKMLEPTFLP